MQLMKMLYGVKLLLDEGDPLTNINLEKSISEIKDRRIFKKVTYDVADGTKKI